MTRWSDDWTYANAVGRVALVRSSVSSYKCSCKSEGYIYVPFPTLFSRNSGILKKRKPPKKMTNATAKPMVNCGLNHICLYSVFFVRVLFNSAHFALFCHLADYDMASSDVFCLDRLSISTCTFKSTCN